MEDGKFKLYSQKAIALATFLGGPLAAGILIRKNSLNLGREREGLMALIIGIVSTILLIFGFSQIPEPILDKIPPALFSVIYIGIIYLIVEKIHGQILKEHKEERNGFYSNWRAAGIGLACSVVLIGGIGGAYVYSSTPKDWDTKSYNAGLEKLGENELEAVKLFDMLDNNSKEEIAYFIEQTGIPKWKESIEILNKMSAIKNLPREFQKQNKLLLEYFKLRIEEYELTSKAILNETSEYDEEIVKKRTRMNEILTEL